MSASCHSENSFWVQCENSMCMKWRRIPKTFYQDYKDISWFCHMNPDLRFNNCNIDQEKMHICKGETVIFSELEVGSLVWAKMVSYPRWPGIISPDPCKVGGCHIARYEDGTNDPRYYHIEFLGEPRSHAWVTAQNVQLYNNANIDLVFLERSMKGKVMKASFQKALLEATEVYNLSIVERLQTCVYKQQNKKGVVKDNKTPGRMKQKEKVKYPSVKHVVKAKEKENDHIKMSPLHESKFTSKVIRKRTPQGSSSRKSVAASEKLPPVKHKSLKKNKRRKDSIPYELVDELSDQNKSFWNDYSQFCRSKNIQLDAKYFTWYNKTIDLFTFFKKVQLVGGYHQAVSHVEIWRNICCDLLQVQQNSHFLSLRKAYKRVLLPFENYLKTTDSLYKTKARNYHYPSEKIDSTYKVSQLDNLLLSPLKHSSPVYEISTGLRKNGCTSTANIKQADDAFLLPSSNPCSPNNNCSQVLTTAQVGLEVTMCELDDLEHQLIGIVDKSQSSSQFSLPLSESLPLIDDLEEDSYQPVLDSAADDDMIPVIGELTNLEDVLVEMAGDILGVSMQERSFIL